MRVLIADDSAMARAVLRRLLRELGIQQVAEASDGKQALERIEREPFDLVLCDWHMPRLDGPGLVGELRRSMSRRLPVLLISREPQDDGELQAAQAGAQGYVRKPLSRTQLRRRIEGITRAPGPPDPGRPSTLSGTLSEVGLPELAQFLTSCRLDGRLHIRRGSLAAWIDVRGGEIRAACCGTLFGDAAVYAIAELADAEFRFEPEGGPVEPNVSMGTMPLLLEAMKQRDERTAGHLGSETVV